MIVTCHKLFSLSLMWSCDAKNDTKILVELKGLLHLPPDFPQNQRFLHYWGIWLLTWEGLFFDLKKAMFICLFPEIVFVYLQIRK